MNCSYGRLAGGSACGARFIRLRSHFRNHEFVSRHHLAVGILAVVAGWRFTPPPRSLVPDAPLAVHIHTDKAMFQVLVSPGRVGFDDFVLQLMNGDGTLLHAKEATLALSLPERGIEEIERQGTLEPDGFWHVGKVPLAIPGRWHMRIDALVSDFEKITLEDDFDVATQ